jgi:hypothetical protein
VEEVALTFSLPRLRGGLGRGLFPIYPDIVKIDQIHLKNPLRQTQGSCIPRECLAAKRDRFSGGSMARRAPCIGRMRSRKSGKYSLKMPLGGKVARSVQARSCADEIKLPRREQKMKQSSRRR